MITLNHAFNGRNIYELMKAICVGRYNPISNAYRSAPLCTQMVEHQLLLSHAVNWGFGIHSSTKMGEGGGSLFYVANSCWGWASVLQGAGRDDAIRMFSHFACHSQRKVPSHQTASSNGQYP